MSFDFAAAKASLHRIVHDTMATDAMYIDRFMAMPVPLRVRWHNQLAAAGDLNGEGYSVSIDTVDKVIFDAPELRAKSIQITRGGTLKLTAPHFGGQVLVIDTRDPRSDAAREVWHVGRDNGEQYP